MSLLLFMSGWLLVYWFCSGAMMVVLVVLMLILLISLMSVGNSDIQGVVLGLDVLSFVMSSLTLWICLLVLMVHKTEKDFIGLTMFVMICLISTFIVVDSLAFYVFFELTLIPMFLLVLKHGSQPERLESGIYLIFYTVLGSSPLLLGLIQWGWKEGTYSFYYLGYFSHSTKMIGLMVMLGFLVKLPIYGLHLWLPKAHVEAPVGGSSLLAGVMLKLGGYGLFRFLPFMSLSSLTQGFSVGLGLWGGVVAGVLCMRQGDMKKLIAYSSITHMGLFFASYITNCKVSFYGGLVMMVSHGLCSSGLFYLVYVYYERSFSRMLYLVKGSGGLLQSGLWSFVLSVLNMGIPPGSGFIGEISSGMGLLGWFVGTGVLLFLVFFLPVIYMIYFYSILCQGSVSENKGSYVVSIDELLVLMLHGLPVVLLVMKLGLFSWI